MKPLQAPPAYDRSVMQQIIGVLREGAAGAFAKGADVELARGERLILKSPDGREWVCGPDNTGSWSCTLKP